MKVLVKIILFFGILV